MEQKLPDSLLGRHSIWAPRIIKHLDFVVFLKEGGIYVVPDYALLGKVSAQDGLSGPENLDAASGPVSTARSAHRLMRLLGMAAIPIRMPDGNTRVGMPRLVPPKDGGPWPIIGETETR